MHPGWFRRKRKNKKQVVIFGFNPLTQSVIEKEIEKRIERKADWKSEQGQADGNSKQEHFITLVTREEIPSELRYYYKKNDIQIINGQILSAGLRKQKILLNRSGLKTADYILLFQESETENFALLQLMRLWKDRPGLGAEEAVELQKHPMVILRCDSEGMNTLITGYYNGDRFKSAAGVTELAAAWKKEALEQKLEEGNEEQAEQTACCKEFLKQLDRLPDVDDPHYTEQFQKLCNLAEHSGGVLTNHLKNIPGFNEKDYDLTILSIPQRQALLMLEEKSPLDMVEKLNIQSRAVHYLLVGMNPLICCFILQAMHLSVLSPDNEISFTIYSPDPQGAEEMLEAKFRSELLIPSTNGFSLSSTNIDGQYSFHFVEGKYNRNSLARFLKRAGKSGMFNYFVFDTSNADTNLQLMFAVENYFRTHESTAGPGHQTPPMWINLEGMGILENYIEKDNCLYPNASVIHSPADVASLDVLIKDELYQKARKYHEIYRKVQIGNGTDHPWTKLSLMQKDSNAAAQAHEKVKESWYDRLYKETGLDLYAALCAPENGLFEIVNGNYIPADNFAEKLEKLHNPEERKAIQHLLAMEHRRWCAYYISRGWMFNNSIEKDIRDTVREHDCLLSFRELRSKKPSAVPYDAVFLLKQKKKEGL